MSSDVEPQSLRIDTWRAGGILRRALAGFRAGWSRLAPGPTHRWFISHGIGLVVVAVATALAAWGLREASAGPAMEWERATMQWFEREFLSYRAALWLQAVGSALVVWPLVVYAAIREARRERALVALSWVAGLALASLSVAAGWAMWGRQGPGVPGTDSPLFNAFPSGHAMQTAFAYGMLAVLWIRQSRSRVEQLLVGLGFGLLLSLVAACRIRVGAHWPTDVIAGLLVGFTWIGVEAIALGGVPARGVEREAARTRGAQPGAGGAALPSTNRQDLA